MLFILPKRYSFTLLKNNAAWRCLLYSFIIQRTDIDLPLQWPVASIMRPTSSGQTRSFRIDQNQEHFPRRLVDLYKFLFLAYSAAMGLGMNRFILFLCSTLLLMPTMAEASRGITIKL